MVFSTNKTDRHDITEKIVESGIKYHNFHYYWNTQTDRTSCDTSDNVCCDLPLLLEQPDR